MLRTQYRMHPEIREFPSREFYAEALQDGDGMAAKTARPWHAHPALGPLTFVSVEGEEYHPEGTNSWANDDEAALILLIIRQLLRYGEALIQGGGLAVVSPYKAQARVGSGWRPRVPHPGWNPALLPWRRLQTMLLGSSSFIANQHQ